VGWGFSVSVLSVLEANYVSSLGTAVAFNDVKADFVALVEGFETCGLDGGKVYEYVFSIFALNETETFFCVEPFYSTDHAMAS
jgi:hypothetical protein